MVARLRKSCFTLLVLLLIFLLLPLTPATAQPTPAASVSPQRAEDSTPEGLRSAPPAGPGAELDNLERAGLLRGESAGGARCCRLNPGFPLHPELKSMILKTTGLGETLHSDPDEDCHTH